MPIKAALCACLAALAMATSGGARAQDMAAIPPETLPAVSTQSLVALADEQAAHIGTQIDAAIAQSITALGQYTGLNAQSWLTATAPGLPARRLNPYADPGVSFAQLGRQNFGSPAALAVALEQRFADSRHLATQIALRHATGPVDLRVNLRGNKPLASEAQMSLSYDSIATYQLSRALALGVKARGSLGTLEDFAPLATHDAGAFARLNLLGKGSLLSAETGYDRKIGPNASTMPGQFRANLNLSLKL
jgi:hypothetical protein